MKLLKETTNLFLITAILLLVATAASAQRSDAKTHDGFYLRMSLGLQAAGLARDVTTDAEDPVYGYAGDSEVKGVGFLSEISLGGTPTTGLVLGGSILSGSIAESPIEYDDEDIEDQDLDSTLNFTMCGLLVDYFFDEETGFHLGGTIGGAVVWAALPEDEDEIPFEFIGGLGWAFALAAGYDFWIANQWSLGVLGRLIYAGVMGEDREEGIKAEEDSQYLAFGILFTALYH